jgi:hypothetical protein
VSVDIHLDPSVAGREERELIVVEVAQMLRERKEKWEVYVDTPPDRRGWRLSLLGPNFQRQMLIFDQDRKPLFIGGVLHSWLAEFDRWRVRLSH